MYDPCVSPGCWRAKNTMLLYFEGVINLVESQFNEVAVESDFLFYY